MATAKQNSGDSKPRRPPATTPEARENQLAALAYDLAEKQLREGTASAQVISHFLKKASPRERIEQRKLALESDFLESKIEAIASGKRVEELYGEALNAMRNYQGQPVEEYDED